MTDPDVAVVVLAFGAEPVLDRALEAVAASQGVALDVVVVDNGCLRADLAELCERHGARLLRPGRNLGFAGGVNYGVALTRGRWVALVNSDAEPAADAIAALVRVAARPEVGIATASVRLADRPELMNSAGNPVHFLGLSWAGGLDEPATAHAQERDVVGCSGAGLVLDRDLWEELGGFPTEYFAYLEDLELSWRTWQLGRTVRFVPDAVVLHHYEFGRHPRKMYLLERNRLLFVLTCYGGRTLALLAPALLAFEIALLGVAVVQGWGTQKVRGWCWVLGHLGWVRARRRWVQASRVVPDRDLVDLWTDRFAASAMPLPRWAEPAQSLLAGYWHLVRRAL